jgi:CheY-like chemotaxis protein
VEAAPAATSLSAGEGELVLVVEDEPAVRDIAAAFVRSLGYRVHAVGNATAAMERLRDDPTIALLFSDVMLGAGMNGKELAAAARLAHPQLAVLLTSGYEDTVPTGEAEAFELLRKPYQREQLATALQRSLQQRRTGA